MTKLLAIIGVLGVFYCIQAKSIEEAVNWKKLKWYTNFKVLNKHIPSNPQTRFKIASDQNFIYFLVEAFEPNMDKLVTKKQAFLVQKINYSLF